MKNCLFVYGTLGPGRPNAHVLENIGGEWSEAFVIGRLVDAGWGADAGYPALVIDDAGGRVDGFLFTSESLEEHWPRLDAFEGEEYERVPVSARLLGGQSVEAQVYSLKP